MGGRAANRTMITKTTDNQHQDGVDGIIVRTTVALTEPL